MKKYAVLSLILCFVMLFVFAGCGEKSESSDTPAKDVVLSDILSEINAEFSISEDDMMAVETTEDLELFYNVAPEDVKQFAAQTTKNTATDIAEIILVEAVDSAAADRVFEALEYRYSSQRDLCASYSAELLAIIDKCSVERNGNVVSLIMSNDVKEIKAFYNAFFE